MTEKILAVLTETGASDYILIRRQKKTAEAFYVKKELHLVRENDVTDYDVRLYRDFEQDGQKMRGSYNCAIFPDSDIGDIRKILADAYTAALYAANPYFMLPEGRKFEP